MVFLGAAVGDLGPFTQSVKVGRKQWGHGSEHPPVMIPQAGDDPYQVRSHCQPGPRIGFHELGPLPAADHRIRGTVREVSGDKDAPWPWNPFKPADTPTNRGWKFGSDKGGDLAGTGPRLRQQILLFRRFFSGAEVSV